jgi:hypothetical protein
MLELPPPHFHQAASSKRAFRRLRRGRPRLTPCQTMASGRRCGVFLGLGLTARVVVRKSSRFLMATSRGCHAAGQVHLLLPGPVVRRSVRAIPGHRRCWHANGTGSLRPRADRIANLAAKPIVDLALEVPEAPTCRQWSRWLHAADRRRRPPDQERESSGRSATASRLPSGSLNQAPRWPFMS